MIMELEKSKKKVKIAIRYLVITISLTWLCQFMPILMGLNVENTSISSFDYASVFFGIGFYCKLHECGVNVFGDLRYRKKKGLSNLLFTHV